MYTELLLAQSGNIQPLLLVALWELDYCAVKLL